ncbi:TPA: hypothetical protein DCL89_00805 [candidate division WWE3 bacterium]|nr:hypothetical protein [candidate division WWE3 bacterium]HBI35532.1 hypothetical protein [candidate division WWE3 bacterium]
MLPKYMPTKDKHIRDALINYLKDKYRFKDKTRIVEELGLNHGETRVDVAVVNGVIHGFEIKSDLDTLDRLALQIVLYNSVLDQATLVVGKKHLMEAMYLVPDWWGILVAKLDINGCTKLINIREATNNPEKKSSAIVKLLWKDEAISILEQYNCAAGFYSKARKVIYDRLLEAIDEPVLFASVRDCLIAREGWRPDEPPVLNDD